MRGYFRSHDKDGSHTHSIRHSRKPLLPVNFMALCFIDNFRSCDSDLDPMTFIDTPDPYPLEIYQICENELPTSRLSKVMILQMDRHTDIHTHANKIIRHADGQ